jgi:hypothetical protein
MALVVIWGKHRCGMIVYSPSARKVGLEEEVTLDVRRSWAMAEWMYSAPSQRRVGMGSGTAAAAGRPDLCAALLDRLGPMQAVTWAVVGFLVRGLKHSGLRWPSWL